VRSSPEKVKPWGSWCFKPCWFATEGRCRCKCKGKFHGAGKIAPKESLARFLAPGLPERENAPSQKGTRGPPCPRCGSPFTWPHYAGTFQRDRWICLDCQEIFS